MLETTPSSEAGAWLPRKQRTEVNTQALSEKARQSAQEEVFSKLLEDLASLGEDVVVHDVQDSFDRSLTSSGLADFAKELDLNGDVEGSLMKCPLPVLTHLQKMLLSVVRWHYMERFKPTLAMVSSQLRHQCSREQVQISRSVEQPLVKALVRTLPNDMRIEKASTAGDAEQLVVYLYDIPADFVDLDSSHDPYDDAFWEKFALASCCIHAKLDVSKKLGWYEFAQLMRAQLPAMQWRPLAEVMHTLKLARQRKMFTISRGNRIVQILTLPVIYSFEIHAPCIATWHELKQALADLFELAQKKKED